MSHISGIIGVLLAVEKALEGTNNEWLLRNVQPGRYFANIYGPNGEKFGCESYSTTPAGALAETLLKYQHRIRQ